MYICTGPPKLYLLTLPAFTPKFLHFLLYLLTLPAFKGQIELLTFLTKPSTTLQAVMKLLLPQLLH